MRAWSLAIPSISSATRNLHCCFATFKSCDAFNSSSRFFISCSDSVNSLVGTPLENHTERSNQPTLAPCHICRNCQAESELRNLPKEWGLPQGKGLRNKQSDISKLSLCNLLSFENIILFQKKLQENLRYQKKKNPQHRTAAHMMTACQMVVPSKTMMSKKIRSHSCRDSTVPSTRTPLFSYKKSCKIEDLLKFPNEEMIAENIGGTLARSVSKPFGTVIV